MPSVKLEASRDLEALLVKDEREHVAEAGLVVHDQQARLAHAAPAVRTSERSESGRPGRAGQQDGDGRSLARAATPRRSRRRGLPRSCRTIAIPSPVPPSNAVEKGVKRRESSSSLIPRPVSVNRMRIPGVLLASDDGQLPARRHRVDGVLGDVVDDLPDLVPVSGDRRGARLARRLRSACASETSSERRKRSMTSTTVLATSKSATRRSCGRTKRRKSSRILERRFDSETMISMSRRSADPTFSSLESTCTEPEIEASGLRISCAMPGRELADGRELRVEARLPLELLQLRQVLEEQKRPLLALGVLQQPQREPERPAARCRARSRSRPGRSRDPGRAPGSRPSPRRSGSRRPRAGVPGARAGSTPSSCPPARFRNVTRCCASVVIRPEDIVAMTLP